jgi:sigma-B regulation protein RsbU (phosphoserine phosphatase)
MWITPRTLQQRLAFFVLLPLTVLLLGMGFSGLIYARSKILDQWGDAAILRLQRAAHQVDMRLNAPKLWLDMYHQISDKPYAQVLQSAIIRRLKAMGGVTGVHLIWNSPSSPSEASTATPGAKSSPPVMSSSCPAGNMGVNTPQGARQPVAVEVSSPRVAADDNAKTVSFISDIKDTTCRIDGHIEVTMSLDYLTEVVKATGWWQSNKAFLVDMNGRILAAATPGNRRQLGETGDVTELKTLQMLKKAPLGIVFRSRFHATEVSGFYRLQEAPWTLVMIAPGSEILTPIRTFRFYYLLVGAGFVLLIVFLVRLVIGKTVSAIKDVSSAARRLALGDFSGELPVRSRDEVGELTSSFNAMAHQLEERMQLKNSLLLAREIQQNLLPQQNMTFCRFDISGKSLYCDDTGGDYFDFLQFPEMGKNRIAVVVGDVADHGISAALLMTTTRALLRSRITQPGSLSEITGDVNRLLGMDTSVSGNFITLFLLQIDCDAKTMQWVRAGHDPALFYDALSDSFRDLGGSGMALGVDSRLVYSEYQESIRACKCVILIGTDGIWETENPLGERFGKERLRQIVRQCHQLPSHEIMEAVFTAVNDFRETSVLADDITLVVIKER